MWNSENASADFAHQHCLQTTMYCFQTLACTGVTWCIFKNAESWALAQENFT